MKRLCSLNLIPSKDDELYFSEIIQYLTKKFNTQIFIPHITIYGNLEMELSTLESITDNVLSSAHAFTANINTIKYSAEKSKTIFFDVINNSYMTHLFSNLKESLYPYGTYLFDLHISLIYKENIPESIKRELIKNIELKTHILIDRYSIVVTENTVEGWNDISQWKVFKEENLQKS